tara:strand:+ start:236 stop:409 length:174 start_codon:yes stop_codon:yes gene_type:complete
MQGMIALPRHMTRKPHRNLRAAPCAHKNGADLPVFTPPVSRSTPLARVTCFGRFFTT